MLKVSVLVHSGIGADAEQLVQRRGERVVWC